MIDQRDLREQAIGLIYDAVAQPSLWSEVVARLADQLGCDCGGILLYDSNRAPPALLVQARLDPFFMKLLIEQYIGLVPETRVAASLPLGTIGSTTSLQPSEVFYESPFYNEWVRPQGHLDALFAVVHRFSQGSVMLHLSRSKRRGHFKSRDMELAHSFAPHLSRAFALRLRIEHLSQQVHEREHALYHFATAILLVDADGRIVFENAAAEDLLRATDGVTARGRILHARDSIDDQALHDAIARASVPDGARRSGSEIVVRREGHRSLLLSIAPLSPEGGLTLGVRGHPTAMVVVSDPELRHWSRIEVFARAYGLTAGEARLLAVILDGTGVESAAKRLDISPATARTHLQRIFHKTHTSRQSELIRLVATALPPLRR